MHKVKDITVTIVNSQNFNATISLFGSNADPRANTVNTHSLYSYNLTGQPYTGLTVFQLLYKKVGDPTFMTKTLRIPTSFQDVVIILNQANLGTFWYNQATNQIFIASDTYVYGQMSIA